MMIRAKPAQGNEYGQKIAPDGIDGVGDIGRLYSGLGRTQSRLSRHLGNRGGSSRAVDGPKNPATAPFDDHLVGKNVIYTPTRIAGPRPLAWSGPRYRWVAYLPENVFQGGLTAPAAQAAALGFRPAAIPTLETGCEGLIDFHFTEAGTALFALNNNIYTLRKQPSATRKR
jgi:hypothetical protein